MMTETLDHLARVLQDAPARLVDISDEDAGRRPAAGGWSAKEVAGHLIDSAANNHQRWVRAMSAGRTEFPAYRQEAWVAAQSYASERWPDLVNLWLLYNRHLLHFLRAIPAEKFRHEIAVGDKPPSTVEELAIDYVGHMERHLAQIFSRAAAAGR